MKIYVNSCGVSQKHDYCWVEEHNNIVEEPEVVKNVQYLIQSEAHSVVLARDENGQLLLLVTGIVASRRDFRNRAIRISVAWVVKESDKKDVQYLRKIASSILMDKLITDIQGTVSFEGEIYGFKVDFNKLKSLVEEKLEDEGSTLEENYHKSQIETISDKTKYSNFKNNIAKELEKCCLRKLENFKILVVVTGIKSKSVLTDAKVWRGLSSLIDQDENNADKPATPNIIEKFISRIQDWRILPLTSFLVIILVISLSLNALLFQYSIAQDREIKNLKFTLEKMQKQEQKQEQKQKQKQEIYKQIQDLQRQSQEIDKQ